MNAQPLFPHFPIPERLAYEFLGTFARCEYALKAGGHARTRANSVEADWDAFARAVNWHFCRVKDPAFKSAVQFYLKDPPRKQVLAGGRLQMQAVPIDVNLPKAEQVLLLVRRVRNNLFHGAKVWSVDYRNRERDIALLEAGLVILKQAVTLNERVRVTYEHGAF